MRYTLSNSRTITIPDEEIRKLMKSLDISENEAIDVWLSDNDYEENEEQEQLDEKAKKVRISKDIGSKSEKKERKKPVIKISDEKKALFTEISDNLKQIYGENVTILTENKLISVNINGIIFKIDIIQQRPPKK